MTAPSTPEVKKGYTLRPLSRAELVEDYRRARGIVLRNGMGSGGTGVTRDQWNSLAVAALHLAEHVAAGDAQ